jgi:hypothetical protein
MHWELSCDVSNREDVGGANGGSKKRMGWVIPLTCRVTAKVFTWNAVAVRAWGNRRIIRCDYSDFGVTAALVSVDRRILLWNKSRLLLDFHFFREDGQITQH